jgi:FlaA1/EpsC-like NDP-sugar epimerase
VRVLDLARDLVRLAGLDPETQPFEVIGLRPGEKLHEELFYASEQVERTASPKVLRAVADAPPSGVRDDVRALLSRATGADEGALSHALLDYVRQLEEPRSEPAARLQMGEQRHRRAEHAASDRPIMPNAIAVR